MTCSLDVYSWTWFIQLWVTWTLETTTWMRNSLTHHPTVCTCFHPKSPLTSLTQSPGGLTRHVTPDRTAIYAEAEIYRQSRRSATLKATMVRMVRYTEGSFTLWVWNLFIVSFMLSNKAAFYCSVSLPPSERFMAGCRWSTQDNCIMFTDGCHAQNVTRTRRLPSKSTFDTSATITFKNSLVRLVLTLVVPQPISCCWRLENWSIVTGTLRTILTGFARFIWWACVRVCDSQITNYASRLQRSVSEAAGLDGCGLILKSSSIIYSFHLRCSLISDL